MKRCRRLGFEWFKKRFVKKVRGKVVSHVGLIDYPMMIQGQLYNVGALHGICTEKQHRGRGFASELIYEALQWSSSRVDFVVLFSKIPSYYEMFSFREVRETRFYLPISHQGGSRSLREMSSPKDDALFVRLFASRAPLSERVWVKDRGEFASFNTLNISYPKFWTLHYSPSTDMIFSFIIVEKTLHLFDVVAKTLPSLEMILDHLSTGIDRIYFYFTCEQFTDKAVSEPYQFVQEQFMVLGKWPGQDPFMISPISHC